LLYYFLLVLWIAHISLFWIGRVKGIKEMVMFAILLSLMTTFVPLVPGVEYIQRDTTIVVVANSSNATVTYPARTINAVQDPVLAFVSFIFMMLYSIDLMFMAFKDLRKARW